MEPVSNSAVVEVPAHGGHGQEARPFIDVSVPLMGLTWLTFLLLALVLYKFAWKPILKGLDLRENSIRKALADAEKARQETAALEERQARLKAETEARALQILSDAQAAARAAADAIQTRAEQEARTLVENARKEISAATEKARDELRRESADLAIALATKVIGDNMDEARNRALVRKAMEENPS